MARLPPKQSRLALLSIPMALATAPATVDRALLTTTVDPALGLATATRPPPTVVTAKGGDQPDPTLQICVRSNFVRQYFVVQFRSNRTY